MMDTEIGRMRELIPAKDRKRKLSSGGESSQDSNPPQSGSLQNSNLNSHQSGPPQSGRSNPSQSSNTNPPLSGPPESGTISTSTLVTGYGLETGLTPPNTPRTPTRASAEYSSTSESEYESKRERDGFVIHKKSERSKKAIEERDRKIASLERQLSQQK